MTLAIHVILQQQWLEQVHVHIKLQREIQIHALRRCSMIGIL